ncbi:acyl-(acyl-carrier-protein)--UDP-N-acetylglucosamine O-acyltransferase [[Leptolyngbya] sp. PCC 7376]|uniref:acyl-ACP--UDP-N-acetylglucosamine O-acyltransferase n=1 Tax=[Leptolyngbya] sp. PCC 7376 TaxID=111781 RepID=UPI00029F3B70|nr:acyl-ACP--UDP-N-acetylglucosamine O-acyltransferase [[Leptolyngbya] sp. PCC 7376]AFY37597.1 acyl-(acyl-carrier-protein)--UDP-N-acetylglucosamine O-acyltransferase [[Leptolyngbya] sp. PCC 7376]
MSTLIHPTAVVHPKAEIHPSVKIGPYAVIGEHVNIGADSIVDAHVVIDGHTSIGEGNHFYPGAAIGLAPQDLKYTGAASLVEIGNHNTFREYVTVNRATSEGDKTSIGSNNLLMAYVHVAHNCVLADNIIIANSVAIAGHVEIESRAVIGGMLGIHQFVHIGKMAMLGGMSRIDRDVPPFMLVEGNPSKVRSLNLVGLKRSGLNLDEMKLLKKAFRTLYRSDLKTAEAVSKLPELGEHEHLHHLHTFLEQALSPQRRGLTPVKRS